MEKDKKDVLKLNEKGFIESIAVVKKIDKENYTVDVVVSSEALDRHGSIIRIKGWELSNYAKLPVLQNCHKAWDVMDTIGKALKVWKDNKNKQLIARFQYFVGENNTAADYAWTMIEKFGLAAYSVGFQPKDTEKITESDKKEFPDLWVIFNNQELLEISHVGIPANPEAVLNSFDQIENINIRNEYKKKFNEEEWKKAMADLKIKHCEIIESSYEETETKTENTTEEKNIDDTVVKTFEKAITRFSETMQRMTNVLDDKVDRLENGLKENADENSEAGSQNDEQLSNGENNSDVSLNIEDTYKLFEEEFVNKFKKGDK